MQLPAGNNCFGHLEEIFVLLPQGLHMIMNILFHNVKLLHSSVTLVKTPVQTLVGMLRVEFISLIICLILVSELWITRLLAKDTVAQYAVITRSIFCLILSGLGLFFLQGTLGISLLLGSASSYCPAFLLLLLDELFFYSQAAQLLFCLSSRDPSR